MQSETNKDMPVLQHVPEKRTMFYNLEEGFRLDKSTITFKGVSLSDGLLSPVTSIQAEELWRTGPSLGIVVIYKIFRIIGFCEVNKARKLLPLSSYKTVVILFSLQKFEHLDIQNKSFIICFVKV
jgi:hypothetical protein